MKIVCPENAAHKKFSVTAHVSEEWIVDATGEFVATVERGGGQVTHRPDSGDYYVCAECSTDAKVTA